MGFTLVEVVSGLALLSTLLVALLVGFRAHATQVRNAQDRLMAIQIADRLLAKWTAEEELPPVGAYEMLPGDKQMSWRIVQTESLEAKRLGMQVIRLEVIRSLKEKPSQVLASVELLVPGSESVVD